MMPRILKTLAIGFTFIAIFTVGQKSTHADPIVVFTAFENNFTGFFPGVSFTTPGGPSYNNISFNFYRNFPAVSTPTAAGTLFILTQAYNGAPSTLTSGAPGFLAQSLSISAGQYVFDPSLTLLPSTTYFFYANTAFTFTGGSPPPGIVSLILPQPFPNPDRAPNFLLSGTQVSAVPEPATLLLLSTGLASLVGAKLKRRTKR